MHWCGHVETMGELCIATLHWCWHVETMGEQCMATLHWCGQVETMGEQCMETKVMRSTSSGERSRGEWLNS